MKGETHDDNGEERVNAKFSVDEQELEKLKADLEENLNPYGLEEIGKISDFNDIWSDLKGKELLNYYEQFREGNKAKTIIIRAFIATDSTGEYYFYIFY